MEIKRVTWNSWDVKSWPLGETHMVALEPRPSCTCMDWTIRGQSGKECIHIKAVKEAVTITL